jgi:AcrR family transcriptional regulator
MTRRIVNEPMPRALGRPRDGDSTETRDRLLRVARRAFARNGYDPTTNKEIADAAGLTTGAIYHYYGSKAELYVAVYEEVQGVVYSSFNAALDDNIGLLDRFAGVLAAAVELNRNDPTISGFVLGVTSEAKRHPELAALLQPLQSVNSVFLSRLVGDARERGELHPEVSVQAVEDLLNAVLSGLVRFSNQVSDSSRHAAAVGALQLFLSGTLVRQPTSTVEVGTSDV